MFHIVMRIRFNHHTALILRQALLYMRFNDVMVTHIIHSCLHHPFINHNLYHVGVDLMKLATHQLIRLSKNALLSFLFFTSSFIFNNEILFLKYYIYLTSSLHSSFIPTVITKTIILVPSFGLRFCMI